MPSLFGVLAEQNVVWVPYTVTADDIDWSRVIQSQHYPDEGGRLIQYIGDGSIFGGPSYGSQPLRPLKDWQEEVEDVLSEYELEEVK